MHMRVLRNKPPALLLMIVVSCLFLPAGVHAAERTVAVTVDADRVVNRIDEKIYGHFLEHIFHSVNGGLWGEMVWNRSFEQRDSAGQWLAEDGTVSQKSLA